ncbi:ricin-type beta-trefoil lectin domain protein [Streptomyces sp. 3214.6]|uniref:ricin-type beta-trefoil lectin domain protein n=1 Tax=Streptomyces sp. 3214.6 TaxID=1882757 RepID=UPI00090C3BE3|nr:ricin-type beta-trefoil lectin domain protein [Streptomyces sp. 3214.6]SHI13787.1 Ricin-type beta-trefoil lectin domain-containing protein [Streptomyces sp. 3214.6]
MTLWTSLEPAAATVDPGGSTTVRLRVRNTGDVVDEYRFEPVGQVAPWTSVEPQTLRLFPGTTGTVELTFAPPRTSDAKAGPNPYAVRITPTEHPEAVTVPEGNLTVTPFTEVRAELVPPTVKGRFRGRPRLAIDNLGNTRVTASVAGADTGDHLGYEFSPGSVQIEPGRAAFVDTTLRPRQVIWFGSKEQRPYALSVQRSGAVPLSVDGTFVQRGFLPRWLATALSLSVALAIAFVMIWLAYKPQVGTNTREKLAEAGATALPSPSVSAPSAPKVDASADPLPEQQPPAAPPKKDDSGSGAGGSGDSSGSGSGGKKDTGGSGGSGKTTPVPGAIIIGQASNRCIDVTDAQNSKGKDGTPLQLWDCAGSANQKWIFGKDGTVRSLGLCMDVAWGSRDDGAVIQLANCSGNPAQQFILSKDLDLVNPQANKCVDAKDNGTGNGTKLQLWTCSGTPNQKWRAQ